VKAGNKLSIRNIDFHKQIMKVKLCVQLFSSSVATAMTVCRKLGIESMIGSEDTAAFVSQVDRYVPEDVY